jgi:hypothetical protein
LLFDSSPIFIAKDAPSSNKMRLISFKIGAFRQELGSDFHI